MIEAKNNQTSAPIALDPGADLGFKILRELFAHARRLHPRAFRESSYVLAGRPVRMRIVGRRLGEFMHMPFAHLRADELRLTEPCLTIEIWDQAETNVFCKLGLTRDDLDLHPNLKHSTDRRYASYQLQHSLACLDRSTGFMAGCVSNAEDLSLYERGRPLHVLLSLWHKSLDMPLVHAGLISRSGGGVLLAGPGGSGKSTSAITSACAGFDYLSEDLVSLQSSPGDGFVGHSLYSSTFIEPDHLKRFPLFERYAIKGRYPFEKKDLVLLRQIPFLRFARACRILAVVLPRVMHLSASRLRPASRGEALLTLAPSSLLVGERSHGRESFAKLGKLVEQIPCYWLDLGGGLDEVPRVLDGLLSEIAGR